MEPELNSGVGEHSIAIVGGGFSGVMTAIHAARHAAGPAAIHLIDASGSFGPGVAYGTTSQRHLLNVPAGNMSAFADDASHFLRWLHERGHEATSGTFVQRRVYGEYLRSLLLDTIASLGTGVRLETTHARAVSLRGESGGFTVGLHGGSVIHASAVVLSPGNFAPADHPAVGEEVRASEHYIANPWEPNAIERIRPDLPVLFIGTGLTMVDMALELAERGHHGGMIAVSRRGLLSRSHRPEGDQRPLGRELRLRSAPHTLRTIRTLVRDVRREIVNVAADGHDWHDVIAALRPITPALWQGLSRSDQARFLQHLRPYWDAHRHRLPPEAAGAITRLQAEGSLTVHAGQVESIAFGDDAFTVNVRARGSHVSETWSAGTIVNCMGPNRNVLHCGNALLIDLYSQGRLMPDRHGLGVAADETGSLLSIDGSPQEGLYLIGPLRQGDLWECVAVPELRVHAAKLGRSVGETAKRQSVETSKR